MENDKQKILKRINDLRSQKKTYKEIIKTLNTEGYRTKTGKRFKLNTISYYKILERKAANAIRAVIGATVRSPELPKPAPAQGASSKNITKWNVLRMIEECDDFDAAYKKNLMTDIMSKAI